MKNLLNGCSRSEFAVTPKNWKTAKASIKKHWKIHYRFYDPAFKDHPKYKGKIQRAIRGMNDFHTLEDRQAATRDLIELETKTIDVRGWNPISNKFMVEVLEDVFCGEVTKDTPFIIALELTLRNCVTEEILPLLRAEGYKIRIENGILVYYKDGELVADKDGNPIPEIDIVLPYIKEKQLKTEMEHETVIDCKSVLKYFSKSAAMLKKDQIPLHHIKSKDIKAILDNCKNLVVERIMNKRVEKDGKLVVERIKVNGKMVPVKTVVYQKKVWNDNQFNHFRSYLGILFGKLKKQEILEYNPIDNIEVRDTTPEDPEQREKKVLTDGQRLQINEYTKEKTPEFNRLIHIFFNSGARRKEMVRVQGKHVDLPKQRFKVLVKKRKKWTWVWKTIKDVVLDHWVQAMDGCGPEDYVFSKGLRPGPKPIRPEQITRRWLRHVKKALGFSDNDFYHLKRLHTTEIMDMFSKLTEQEEEAAQVAAEHNSHTSTAMVVNIYDAKKEKRKHNKIRAAGNGFVK